MESQFISILTFSLFIAILIYIDLFLINKEAHAISFKEATYYSIFWFVLALVFAIFIYYYYPEKKEEKVIEYITGYLVEKSLSIDNLFVFIMIFSAYSLNAKSQAIVLKWGIIGAVLMRSAMILVGAALVNQFNWILYIFGIIVLWTAVKMFFIKEKKEDFNPEKSKLVKFIRNIFPVSNTLYEDKIFIRENGQLKITILFIVIFVIELSDVMFAVDSIPAIFAITQDPFIVYTSNIFAILGLRALFFLLQGIMQLFTYLKQGVSIILAFIGVKLLLPFVYGILGREPVHIPHFVSLSFILSTLVLSILISILSKKK